MLRRLLDILPRPAAIIRQDYTISTHNRHFAEVCDIRYGTILDALSPAPGVTRLLSTTETGYQGLEVALHGKVFWCETYSVKILGKITHLLTMTDATQQRAFEASHLEMVIRKVNDDNLWIMGEDLQLLYVRADAAALNSYIGRPTAELVAPADRPAWERCIRAARDAPEQTIECSVCAASDGLPRMITIQYLPSGTYGGRYYAATRRDEPHGIRVLRRIKEAYQIRTDAELAHAMGITPSAVSRANTTGKYPDSWVLNTWRATGVSAHWLLTGQGPKMG